MLSDRDKLKEMDAELAKEHGKDGSPSISALESAADIFGAPSPDAVMVIATLPITENKQQALKLGGWTFTKEHGGVTLPDGTEIERKTKLSDLKVFSPGVIEEIEAAQKKHCNDCQVAAEKSQFIGSVHVKKIPSVMVVADLIITDVRRESIIIEGQPEHGEITISMPWSSADINKDYAIKIIAHLQAVFELDKE